MDEQQRQHILDDLKGFIKGELLFDPLSLGLYSTDASICQVRPAGVVVPRDEEDVQLLVRYATEHRVPLVPRGAGSGLAGEALGTGLVVDLSQHFRNIGAAEGDSIRVQPGVTCRALNDHLAPLGRRFGPDPASAEQCTIGGMIATNASGARLIRHGYTRDHVLKLRIVLDSGDIVEVGKEPVNSAPGQQTGHLQDIIAATSILIEENSGLIRSSQPRTPYNRCGYLLHDVLWGETLDVARLLVGSEGTLAIITEAVLKTIPLPAGRALVLLGFDSLDSALRAVQRILPTGPSACELIDRRLLTLARGSAGGVAALVPPEVEAVLLVEYETDSAEEASWSARRLPHLLARHGRGPLHTVTAVELVEMEHLWHLREAALPSLYGLRPGPEPVAFVEDVAVPMEELAGYLHRVQDILQEHETTASFLIHAGTGQVHTRPFLDLNNPQEVSKLSAIAEKVHTLALDLGGTISTQHGTGLIRTPWVTRQYRQMYPVLRQIKLIFDPQNIFNPGKIVDPDPELSGWPLRQRPVEANGITPLLRWPTQQWQAECLKCNGCGLCRTETPPARMCPVFHATHGESATPRAKANLLRDMLRRDEQTPVLASNEVREVADLCVNCRMCAQECPAHVNIPKLMLEAKAQNVAEHGLDRKEWFLARVEGLAWWGSTFSLLINFFLRSPTLRWWLEKLFGLSRQRRLPRFAHRSFLRQARRRGWTRPPQSGNPRVAYFVDSYANHVDPLVAQATVAVLQHNGIDVYIPPGQRGCGMSALAHGDVETAREIASKNLRALADAAREGYTIICSEPTAALMLSKDYLDLLDDDDAQLVAGQTVELTDYLWQLHSQGKLRTDFKPLPLSLGHHVPCHLKALGEVPAGPRLLALIPELRVHEIDVSCSGMAGTYGLGAENYATSLEAGRPMLEELKRPRVLFGSTECSTCRMQMEDGTGKRTLHPVQYLALAYGLLPEIARRLEEPFGQLVLR